LVMPFGKRAFFRRNSDGPLLHTSSSTGRCYCGPVGRHLAGPDTSRIAPHPEVLFTLNENLSIRTH
jgi:hypothetical protein